MNKTMNELLELRPDDVLADDNSRFGLKKFRIERLASEILQSGGVNTPVEVEEVDPKANGGFRYRLVAGFYRHAAVSLLNQGDRQDFKLPATLFNPDTPAVRLRRQLSENMERENQSPMDKAVAIKKLKAAGASTMDV